MIPTRLLTSLTVLVIALPLAARAWAQSGSEHVAPDPGDDLFWFIVHNQPVSLDMAITELEQKLDIRLIKGPRLFSAREPVLIRITNTVCIEHTPNAFETAKAILKANDVAMVPLTAKARERRRYVLKRLDSPLPSPFGCRPGSHVPFDELTQAPDLDGRRPISTRLEYRSASSRAKENLARLADGASELMLIPSVETAILSGAPERVRNLALVARSILEEDATRPRPRVEVIPVNAPVEEILRELEEALGR